MAPVLNEDLKTILKDKCDFTVLSTEVTINQIRYWKLIDIVSLTNYLENPSIFITSNKLKLLLEANNNMWVEKFKVALVSNNIYDEVMIFIEPGEFDIYSVTNYEDILFVLREEFLSNLIRKCYELDMTSITKISTYGQGYYTFGNNDYNTFNIVDNTTLNTTVSTSTATNYTGTFYVNELN